MENWLTMEEKTRVIEALMHFGLIKWDNKRNLPLKSGGKTDIYANLRDMRSVQGATDFLARVYGPALLRLGVKRFVEVPEAVSGLAGAINALFSIPYITIRTESKEGRVSDAKTVGSFRPGELVTIMDDVITDGASKLGPYRECMKLGLQQAPMVVLVDRQQGWKQTFERLGINVPIWAGMTLHDIRTYLIGNGIMERCDPTVEAKNPIILAYDGKTWEEMLPLLDLLRTSGCIIKVNDVLFDEGISNLLPKLSIYGRVMADIKGHDIPQTITNIMNRCQRHLPWAVTIHASGGKEMITAAVKAFEGTATKVLAVTVLTSLGEEASENIYHALPREQVLALAKIACEAGAQGLVCSPKEVQELRSLYPDMTLVTPGVRSAGTDTHDQSRVDTPENAVVNGANYVVIGREIMGNIDPYAKAMEIYGRLANTA